MHYEFISLLYTLLYCMFAVYVEGDGHLPME